MISHPIIVGVAQFTQRGKIAHPLDPMGLMTKTSLAALTDACASRLKETIDSVRVIHLFQWSYRNAPGELSERLDLKPRETLYLPMGGNTPQMAVNQAARDLAAGRCRAVLLTGAEAIYSLRRALKGEIVLDWPESRPPEKLDGENINGFDNLEERYDLYYPSYMYPLFETSLRASLGRSTEEHRMYMGKVFERLSRIASQNPYAWSQKALCAEEIATPTEKNRYIGYPYTKYMNANVDVDQAASVILTTEKTARSLGIPEDKWIYPTGGAEFQDIWYVNRRPCLHASPAIRHASQIALKQAGLILEDIDFFDIYSCFPSAFEIARKEIGIPEFDSRDLSVTGGLPFFGGPGNNYTLHAIASVVERIRKNRLQKAMVTANGWYLTKHAIGIYAGFPSVFPWSDRNDSAVQRSIHDSALPTPIEKAHGLLTVEAYVIRHDKTGQPQKGTVLGKLEDGGRTLADMDANSEELLHMENFELVGRRGPVRYDEAASRNFFRFSNSA
jgi:acetyl-CoA C-acetyltransferase